MIIIGIDEIATPGETGYLSTHRYRPSDLTVAFGERAGSRSSRVRMQVPDDYGGFSGRRGASDHAKDPHRASIRTRPYFLDTGTDAQGLAVDHITATHPPGVTIACVTHQHDTCPVTTRSQSKPPAACQCHCGCTTRP